MEVTIKSITVGLWKTNCYLIAFGNEGLLVDPGEDFETIINSFNLDNIKLKGIINTHGHFDHIGAVAELKERYKIPFFIHSKDKRLIGQSNIYRGMAGDPTVKETPIIDDFLDNFEYIELKDKKVKIHYTPGHTAGCVCFEIDGNLFTGDTIYNDNIGRYDLPSGNKDMLINSINYILKNFKGYKIYSGHGESFILDEKHIENIKEIMVLRQN